MAFMPSPIYNRWGAPIYTHAEVTRDYSLVCDGMDALLSLSIEWACYVYNPSCDGSAWNSCLLDRIDGAIYTHAEVMRALSNGSFHSPDIDRDVCNLDIRFQFGLPVRSFSI